MKPPSLRDVVERLPCVQATGTSSYALRLQEDAPALGFTVPAEFDPVDFAHGVQSLFGAAIRSGLVSAEITVDKAGVIGISLSPAGNCGFASVRDDSASIFVEVVPKLPKARLFTLLTLAGDARAYIFDTGTELDSGPDAPLFELVARAYALSLQRLVRSTGLRGLHEHQEQTLVGRVRGRVVVPQYLREFAAGRPHRVPCAFSTLTVDNIANRLLRWALHALLATSPSDSGTAVALEELDAQLGAVALKRVSTGDLRRIARLPETFRQYYATGALPLAAFIIRNLSLDARVGALPALSVAFPFHEVFEHAFAAEMARRADLPRNLIEQIEWRIEFANEAGAHKSGTFKPDVVLPPSSNLAGLIADTKWKTCLDRGVAAGGPGTMGEQVLRVGAIKLCNADLFQVLAYLETARHRYAGAPFVGALVYPVTDIEESGLTPVRLRIGEGNDLPLYLVPWDVGAECVPRLDLLWNALTRLREVPPFSEVEEQGS